MNAKQAVVAPFEYASMGAEPEEPGWTSLVPNESMDSAPSLANVQKLQAEETALEARIETRIAAARAEGYQQARREQQEENARKAEQTRETLANAVLAFAADRSRYFGQVEPEVVRLALAIAARILHREAHMDPLLLSGAVRVALGQLSDATEVRLRVPVAEADLWREMLRLLPHLPLRPELVPDDQLLAGECRLETHLGSVDLGVKAQLAEIERGFFDLLDHRIKEHRINVPHAAIA